LTKTARYGGLALQLAKGLHASKVVLTPRHRQRRQQIGDGLHPDAPIVHLDRNGVRSQLVVCPRDFRNNVERAVSRPNEVVERRYIDGIGSPALSLFAVYRGGLELDPAMLAVVIYLSAPKRLVRVLLGVKFIERSCQPLQVLAVERRRDIEVARLDRHAVQKSRNRPGNDVQHAVPVEHVEQRHHLGRIALKTHPSRVLANRRSVLASRLTGVRSQRSHRTRPPGLIRATYGRSRWASAAAI
jgi:hypothetical protein